MKFCFLVVAFVVLGCCNANADPSRGASAQARFEAVTQLQADPHKFTTLHVFSGSPDGSLPGAGLLYYNGTLYGATNYGGEGHNHFRTTGHGMIFALAPSGKLRPLYKFHDIPDGSVPADTLVAMNGVFYGTTADGGSGPCSGGCGTVFEVTTSGKERIIYNFQGATDGYDPSSGLIVANGLLYGTTAEGGGTNGACGITVSCGTVFEVSTSGRERVLYRFSGGVDGSQPFGNLTLLNGNFYGATLFGGAGLGAGKPKCSPGCGTIFEVSLSGKERVIHQFTGGADGAFPSGGLLAIDGALYGTTAGGGDVNRGTVFSMTTTGDESILCDFKTAEGGYSPSTPLLAAGDALYGMTQLGGPGYYGTVYKVTAAGAEQTLHAFDSIDGYFGASALIEVNGMIFGTTAEGGTYDLGTIFSLSP